MTAPAALTKKRADAWFRLIPIVIGDGKSLIMSTIATSKTMRPGVPIFATKNGSSVTEALHLRYRSPQMSTVDTKVHTCPI